MARPAVSWFPQAPTWAKGQLPTPEQYLDWITSCDRDEALFWVNRLLTDANRGLDCVMSDRSSKIAQMTRKLAKANRRADYYE